MTSLHSVTTPEFWWDEKEKDFTTADVQGAVHCVTATFDKSVKQLIEENPDKRIFIYETENSNKSQTRAVIMDDNAKEEIIDGHFSASPLPHDQGIVFVDHSQSINEPAIVFRLPSDKEPILLLKDNGDIFVRGKLVENDKEVVQGMRDFLSVHKQ